jgi:predicted nucleotidyltransferase
MMMLQQLAIQQYFGSQPVRKAYLFGSQARGEATNDSDIDILVELEPMVYLFDFVRMRLQLEDLLHKPVDLVSTNGLSPYVKPYIDQDKKLIYEKANE